MLILLCPNCGVKAEETEYLPSGEGHIKRFGPDSTDGEFQDYLFKRRNPRGVHFERWCHSLGCGKWFHVARCTVTLEVFATYSAQTSEVPPNVIKAIKAKRPDWDFEQDTSL